LCDTFLLQQASPTRVFRRMSIAVIL